METKAMKWWEKTEAELEAEMEAASLAIEAMEAAKKAKLAAWARDMELANIEADWAEKDRRGREKALAWARAKE